MPRCSLACLMTSYCLTYTLQGPGCLRTGHIMNIMLTTVPRQLTETKFLLKSSVWILMKSLLTQEMMNQASPPATLGESSSESDTADDDPSSSPLATDLKQYELMQTAYKAVGLDFEDKEDLIGPEYHKLLRQEAVLRRWPLARLSIPLQKIVDHLDRVLAGCCWKAFATRSAPDESLPSIKQASKHLTMLLAGYLAKEVAAILREIMTHPTKQLYDDNTVHLLCSNYWLQPIYQELLHSSSRYNATVTGEKNRPCSGLARVSAHPRPPKIRKPSATANQIS